MDKEEKNVVEPIKKITSDLDEKDKILSAQHPISMGEGNKALVSFANAPPQKLTPDQFMRRFKEVSKGTFFESIARIADIPATDRNRIRTTIEKALSKYSKMYPINNFKKREFDNKN